MNKNLTCCFRGRGIAHILHIVLLVKPLLMILHVAARNQKRKKVKEMLEEKENENRWLLYE